jgi:thymidylate kinase
VLTLQVRRGISRLSSQTKQEIKKMINEKALTKYAEILKDLKWKMVILEANKNLDEAGEKRKEKLYKQINYFEKKLDITSAN